jgi:hypothetical protein
MKKQKTKKVCICIALAITLLMVGGCVAMKSHKTQPAGFLGDYSQLKEGKTKEWMFGYVNPAVSIQAYTSILMDPIRIYVSKEYNMKNVSSEDQQKILNYADATIRKHLAQDYTLVQKPGPGVMRLRIAITEAENSSVAWDTVSTIMPISLAISGITTIASGSAAFVGSAGVEAELQDSLTGTRLMAGVDRRMGGKITGKFDKFDKWHTVKNSIDYWAKRLQTRFAEERAK